ncbi:MAG TPA: choice-of-anchor Q domain-containing protein [Rudaea sp.]|nr:choice-of-anchor Q domain-containing protein [Rudaea sp.]
MRNSIPILVGLALAAFAAVSDAGTFTVNDASDAGPGNCAGTCTLRDAIASAATGDTIAFALASPATIALNGQELLIYKSLNIAGPGPGLLTISGNNQSRVFEIANTATVSVQGLAIANGRLVGTPGANDPSGTTLPGSGGIAQGGAIYVGIGSNLWLSDCDIHDNAAIGGAGGTENSDINSMAGGTGGPAEGGALYAAGDVRASHCTFRANSAIGGQGGDNAAFFPAASGGNPAGGAGSDGHGGAIAGSGTVELIDVTLAGNHASGGNGGNLIFLQPNWPGGAGGNAGGGALSIAGFSVFEFVTSAANSAVAGSGGFGIPAGPAGSATASDLLLGATVVARSSVFGSATAPACTLVAGGISAQGANLDPDGSCPGFTLHTDPKLAPLAPNVGGRSVMFPLSGSPLIDAAIDCQDAFGTAVTDDELGTPRPQGSKCDLGAIEADYIFVDGFGG